MDRDEFSLDRFRLDMRQPQLTRDVASVPLSNRAFDVLCMLAGANGEVVSKHELMTRVWPGLVVEENNIQVRVSALRKALDDGKSGVTYLTTVPERNSSFIYKNNHPRTSGRRAGPGRVSAFCQCLARTQIARLA